MSEFSVIGRRLPKVNSWAHLTGEARYPDALFLPRMLYGRVLRSTRPHARIRRVDTGRALAYPGVVAVVTGADMPEKMGIMPSTQDETALAVDRVRYVGEPVAAVAALDEDIAFDALSLIQVDYEDLEPIFTIEEALEREDVKIHDEAKRANVFKEVHLSFGDLEGGFAAADHVRDDWFFFEGNTHAPIESHSAVASYGPDDKLTLWTATQVPHYLHRELEKVLGLPRSRIRVIATPNGGAFGGKSDPFGHEFAAALLSMRTRRPVKITLDREEVFYAHRGRHPVKMRIRTGVKKDGEITAVHYQSFLDGGAYASYGIATTYYTGALLTVTYRIPAYKFDGVRVYTNKPPCGAEIRIDRGGGVTVMCGTSEIGQGSDMVLASVTAEALGVLPEDVHVVSGDTSLAPVDLGSYSSRVTFMAGNATKDAAMKLRALVVEAAAEKLGVPAERLLTAYRRVYDRDDPSRFVTFTDAAVLAESKHGTLVAAGSYKPPKGIGGTFKGAGVGPSPAYSYQATVAEVSVDLETGTLTVDKLTTAHDCGRALNPANVEGQIEGSAYMGYGEVVVEEQIFRGGLHKKPSLLDYKLPTSLDTPALEAIVVESVGAEGPFGAKEAGEGPLNPVIPAIANAVYDAIGVRVDETPITAEKILDALGLRDNRRVTKDRIGPDGLGDGKADPKRALRRLGATTDARERRTVGGLRPPAPD